MRFHALALIGLTLAATSHAQQSKSSTVILVDPHFVGVGCPGQLTAQQQATGGGTVWTTALEDHAQPSAPLSKQHGLGVHVEFTGLKVPIKQLELRVDYLPLGLREMPAAATLTNTAAKSPAERDKTFNLERDASLHIHGDLLVGPAATITRVHLVSATFADATVWRAPTADACTVVPNRVMLVAQR